jgi:hypothetical protein
MKQKRNTPFLLLNEELKKRRRPLFLELKKGEKNTFLA